MLGLTPTVRVFVAAEPVDMRGSFNALAGAARRLGFDPLDGHLYVFVNRRRQLAKVLWFDGSGYCVLAKRLERGTFRPSTPPRTSPRPLASSAKPCESIARLRCGPSRRR